MQVRSTKNKSGRWFETSLTTCLKDVLFQVYYYRPLDWRRDNPDLHVAWENQDGCNPIYDHKLGLSTVPL